MFKSKGRFFCFSPPVMIATFVLEISLAVYTVVRYRMSSLIRLAAALLGLLALFQLAEFNVCAQTSTNAQLWSRLGYVAITLLPPLGLHLIFVIAKLKRRALVWLAYATGFGFAAAFGLNASLFAGHVCAGNYAIFQLAEPIGGLYFAYYYTWLFVGIAFSLYLSYRAPRAMREALLLQVVGYLSFLLPTGLVNTINPQSIAGIPSVMCGFAVIYALILALGIVPSLKSNS